GCYDLDVFEPAQEVRAGRPASPGDRRGVRAAPDAPGAVRPEQVNHEGCALGSPADSPDEVTAWGRALSARPLFAFGDMWCAVCVRNAYLNPPRSYKSPGQGGY